MTTILYLHGFASFFKPNSDKAQSLSALGNVIGLNLDYSQASDKVITAATEFAQENHVSLIVGCSLGGWLAAQVGSRLEIPFVCLNPSITPSQTLARYRGEGETFDGKPFYLSDDVIASYDNFPTQGTGLVLLQRGDDILDAELSFSLLSSHFQTYLFDGGSHRFDGLDKQVSLIKDFMVN